MQELKGLGVAMVTPFTADGKVDYNALQKLVKHLHNGADYLVVMGTTGEAITLSEEEQFAVLDYILEVNRGELPVVFGMGGSDTRSLCERMKAFDREGVVAFLTASPAYNKPTQEGVFRHYRAIGEASPLPVIMYNVPGRTASNVLPETVARIAEEVPKVNGIKEAAGDIEQVMELKRLLPESFLLISGDDALVLPHMACGGHGVISVLGNAYPKAFGDVVRTALAGDLDKARKGHLPFLPLISNLFAEGNPGGVKAVLKHLGICDEHMRLPLYPVSNDLRQALYRNVANLE
ncbi:MAG: 4-hydroxy-tetrahydrodipicolinate synthase [Cryomorphaceae bacterium]|nr:4-hydroxy-tetrahydrodipicolinate synthase [Flavobacteriales bacterium]